jgi:YspA, cpYpsA-related SLOG family
MREIFVFGSNLAGRHGAGAALYARQHHGAQLGVGMGLTGDAYAIPTKDENLQTLPLKIIRGYVRDFLTFATKNPDLTFKVTAIGCGLAGYKPVQIAPMFNLAPENVILPPEFSTYFPPRIAVTGGRNYDNRKFVYTMLDSALEKFPNMTLVHGGATGADSLAHDWAVENNVEMIIFEADWETYGKNAGPIRNKQMAESGICYLIAFTGGAGTNNMFQECRRLSIPTWDLRFSL